MRNHKFSLRAAGILLSVPLALILTTAVALGHHVISLSGTVDCDGNYTVNVNANVFGSTHLITTLNGVEIGNEQPGGQNANHAYEYTGSGAEAGDPIRAIVSDDPNNQNNTAKDATLVLTQEVCESESESPSPSESPSDSPSPSETPTVSESASPSDTPSETPTQTIPNTSIDTPSVDFGGPVFLFAGFLLVGLAVLLIADALTRRTRS